MMQIFHFRFVNTKMNLSLKLRWCGVTGVRYIVDRCGLVQAMVFVIVMSSFYDTQCSSALHYYVENNNNNVFRRTFLSNVMQTCYNFFDEEMVI